MNSRFATGAVLALLWLAPMTALAQGPTPGAALPEDVPGLRAVANQAHASGDLRLLLRAVQALHAARPYNSDYQYQLVLAHAQLGERREAYDTMLRMQRQGLSYDFSVVPEAESLKGTEVFNYVNDLMVRAGEPYGEAVPAFTLPDGLVLPEALAWDAERERFLVGSVRDGVILAVDPDGEATELVRASDENGLWSIFGLAVDAERDRLWVSSAATRNFSGFRTPDIGRSALFEFKLGSMELVRRYPVPVDGRPHQLGNLAIAPGGDVFVADGAFPMIYRLRSGGEKLEPFLFVRDFVSLRGMDITPDGRVLYVADYELGVLAVDVEAERAMLLKTDDTLNLGGIDGLFHWNGHLVLIQNGIRPQRVMRLELEDDRVTVKAIRPLAVAQPQFADPNYGAIVGEDLYYFANSHWNAPPGAYPPVQVVKTGLNSGTDMRNIELEKFLEETGLDKPKPAGAGNN